MTSGNTSPRAAQPAGSASGNTGASPRIAGGVIGLPVQLAAELARYQRALARAPLAGATRTKYVARVRGFLVWLAAADLSGYDETRGEPGVPLTDPAGHLSFTELRQLDAALRLVMDL